MPRVDKGDETKCDLCGEPFIADMSHDEAVAQMETFFGREVSEDDRAIVCDDCYKKLLPWYEAERRAGRLQ